MFTHIDILPGSRGKWFWLGSITFSYTLDCLWDSSRYYLPNYVTTFTPTKFMQTTPWVYISLLPHQTNKHFIRGTFLWIICRFDIRPKPPWWTLPDIRVIILRFICHSILNFPLLELEFGLDFGGCARLGDSMEYKFEHRPANGSIWIGFFFKAQVGFIELEQCRIMSMSSDGSNRGS